jgi:sarcosine oxidase subunit alpha
VSRRLAGGGARSTGAGRSPFAGTGACCTGYEGDTLASALLANGETLVGRSFKYHRPRGVVASGVEEPNALVGLGRGGAFEPNARATTVELTQGLDARSQNHWPSLERDVGVVNAYAARMLPAGFYYKTFLRPRAAWKHVFEPLIRRSAGLGAAPTRPDPDGYEFFYAFVDVLVVGGGVAGLAAARAAAASGGRVLVVEQAPAFGGRTAVDGGTVGGLPAAQWLRETLAALEAAPNVTLRTRMTAAAVQDHGYVLAAEGLTGKGPRERLWRIRAKRVVTATGAIERPLPFAGNDLPGVMLASAVRDYLGLWGVAVGGRVAVVTNNDDAYRTALALRAAGVEVPAVLDARPYPGGALPEAARAAGLRVVSGAAVAGVKGRQARRLRGVCDHEGRGTLREEIACDALAMSGGWSPVVHLWSQPGGKLLWDEARAQFVPDPARPPRGADGAGFVIPAGCASGALTLSEVMESAHRAGRQAAEEVGLVPGDEGRALRRGTRRGRHAPGLDHARARRAGAAGEGVPRLPERRQGFGRAARRARGLRQRRARQALHHARHGDGPGQALQPPGPRRARGRARRLDPGGRDDDVPPPLHARDARDPRRRGPRPSVQARPQDADGRLARRERRPVGAGRRLAAPLLLPPPRRGDARSGDARNPQRAACGRAARRLHLGQDPREGAGRGPLPRPALHGVMSSLAVGKCRYGLMCNENGFLFDDGVVARLGEHAFLCHTTSGGSDRVHAWMEEWLQTEWWDLKVWTANLTEQYAQVAIVGPRARDVLEALGGMDVGRETLPFMGWREGTLADMPARVYRISFSGELSYEIAVPANRGQALWDAARDVGARFGLQPYGTEALHVMRAEKGFIMIGDETDGTVTPQDLGLGWAVSKKKADFIGKRAQERPDLTRSRPPAARRAADGGPRRGAARRGSRGGRAAAERGAHPHARPRHLQLLLADPRTLHRAGAGRGRRGADGRDAGVPAGGRTRGPGADGGSPSSSTRRGAAGCLSAWGSPAKRPA